EARRDAADAATARAEARRNDAERRVLKDEVKHLRAEVDELKEKLELQSRMDKAQRIRDALRDLPGRRPDGDDEPTETHHPSGELHDLGPPDDRSPAVTQPGHHFNADTTPRVPRR